jgi:hypothetical protein
MDDEGTNVGIICLYNNPILKVINKFELLLAVSVCDESRAIEYRIGIPSLSRWNGYLTAMA